MYLRPSWYLLCSRYLRNFRQPIIANHNNFPTRKCSTKSVASPVWACPSVQVHKHISTCDKPRAFIKCYEAFSWLLLGTAILTGGIHQRSMVLEIQNQPKCVVWRGIFLTNNWCDRRILSRLMYSYMYLIASNSSFIGAVHFLFCAEFSHFLCVVTWMTSDADREKIE